MSQRRLGRRGQQIPLFAEPRGNNSVANTWSAEVRGQLMTALGELLLGGIDGGVNGAEQPGGRDERQSDG
jgi:hypothetical protein